MTTPRMTKKTMKISEHPLVKGVREMWSNMDYIVKMGQEQVNKLNEAIIKITKEIFETYDEATRRFLRDISIELSKIHAVLSEVMYRLRPEV